MTKWTVITEEALRPELQFAYNQRMKYDAVTKWVEKKNGMWALAIPKQEYDYIYKTTFKKEV